MKNFENFSKNTVLKNIKDKTTSKVKKHICSVIGHDFKADKWSGDKSWGVMKTKCTRCGEEGDALD